MEDIERVRERLENIRSVEPIISSLRTVAAGGWRQALRRLRVAQIYVDNLSAVLATWLRPGERRPASPLVAPEGFVPRRVLMVVIASERGLCGAFNNIVLEGAQALIVQQQIQSEQVRVMALGARAEAFFRRQGRDLYASQPLPITRVASLDMVRDLGATLLDALYAQEFDAIMVVYSPYQSGATAPPVSRRWLPVDPSILPMRAEEWLQPIIETDPQTLFQQALEEWILARLYQFIMESAASEHSARFRAMDNASNNLARMIEELTLAYHTARQHAITMEMLDLVAGSGILRGPRGENRA
ncbi:MAG: F0F1 ATP synthase subunit gamma [Chloroflexi bacterium]|nr:F0F1 ATP synthase subunit gamma [Chloroflexota bacterium]